MILEDFRKSLITEINPDIPYDTQTKLSAVLIVIYDGDYPKILMTKKSSHLKIHAGEIAFPGGKMEPDDDNLLHTALRESREELNLEVSESQIIGQLEPVRTLNSNFTIVPFVCVLNSLPKLRHNYEVEQVLQIPIHSLLKTLQKDRDPLHNAIKEMYVFTFCGNVIWGASARMLKQIADRIADKNAS